MRTPVLFLAAMLAAGGAAAAPAVPPLPATSGFEQVRSGSTHVRGHVTRGGTYVPPHARTAPNRSRTDNWSSRGNINPRTGERGTQNPFALRR
ncbi:hypothetical protein [Falsiroseomonas sp. CW058]|uniref:hypothetical protein n=1 Tax=Falsiroseomonas sp. CW058 TaxID=3388664 RepID=UPI003D3103E3